MASPGPFTRQALIEAEIDDAQRRRLPCPAGAGTPPAAEQLLQVPVAQVRFLQVMAEQGSEARPIRLGAEPPDGHVLFRSWSD